MLNKMDMSRGSSKKSPTFKLNIFKTFLNIEVSMKEWIGC